MIDFFLIYSNFYFNGDDLQLEFHLHEMEIELQSLIWEKKELFRQLQIAIEDSRFLETILTEIEEEHNKAIAKIKLLKNEVFLYCLTNPEL